MNVAVRSHVGLVMQTNQDAYLQKEGKYPVYAVADGMGGHWGGAVASARAIKALSSLVDGSPCQETLAHAFAWANQSIYEKQLLDESLRGMGTTLTCLWEGKKDFYLAHVGDSRCYLLRDGRLFMQSTDHSVVGDLLRKGLISKEEAAIYPYRNVITRAIGTQRRVKVDQLRWDKKPGDRILLCSDGLTEYVKDEELGDILAYDDIQEGADRLLQCALQLGGHDNITLIIGEVLK